MDSKPDSASAHAISVGAIPNRIRAAVQKLPELANVRDLQTKISAAQDTLAQVMEEGQSVHGELHRIQTTPRVPARDHYYSVEKAIEAADRARNTVAAEVQQLRDRLDLALFLVKNAMLETAAPAIDSLRTELKARASQLNTKLRELVTEEMQKIARELAVTELAIAEIDPSAPLLDARIRDMAEGVVLSVLASPVSSVSSEREFVVHIPSTLGLTG